MALLHLETRPIETSGVMETRAFTMKANGKAFKVLIDGLYSDKVRAVIRELASNAYDAQVDAGRADVPFQMHLPTVYEPFFSVRDFGTSMSHEDVMGLYTTVFESSKENSSTQVGKLGLGSKSPFAYTDTFTVTAFLNGEKRLYSAFIGSDYIPQITLMSRETTDESDGLEVSFPTRPADKAAFEAAASFTLIGFDVQPVMTGAPLGKDPRGKLVMEGPGWAVYDHLSGAYARQGCVIYPIDTDALPYDDNRAVLMSGILIDFPIGALEISASRESLGYDQQTIDNIMGAAANISQSMLNEALRKLNALPTLWEKIIFIHGMVGSDAPDVVTRALREAVFGDSYGSIAIRFNPMINGALEFKSYGSDQIRRPSHPKRIGTPVVIDLLPDATPMIVFNDSAKPAVKNHWGRITNYVRSVSKHITKCYVIRYDSRVRDTKADFLAAAEGAPLEHVVDIHDLTAPPTVSRAGQTVKIKARQVISGGFQYWPSADVDLKAGGYYVPLLRGKVEGFGYWDGRDVADLVSHLKFLGVIDANAEVYGILPSTKALKNGKWLNILALAKDIVANCADELATHEAIKKAKDDTWSNRRTTGLVQSYFPAEHAICAYHEQRAWIQKYAPSETVLRLRKVAAKIGDLDAGTNTFPILDWADVCKPYPLLRELSSINHDNIEDVADYVSLVDNRNKARQAA